MRHGKRAAEERRDRAESQAAALEEVLADVAHRQMMAITDAYETGALTAAAGDPAPPFDWRQWWRPSAWAAALREAEQFLVGFIIRETSLFGIEVTAEQPFVQRQAASHIADIEAWTDELKETVGRLIDDGHRRTLSVKAVADNLREAGIATQRRAELIARTEMIAASNAATHFSATAIAKPGDKKLWLSGRDERVRPSHRRADGQSVPIGDPFVVGGEQGDHPGSSQFSPKERSACRCTFIIEPAS